jgi:hypothetical protein
MKQIIENIFLKMKRTIILQGQDLKTLQIQKRTRTRT